MEQKLKEKLTKKEEKLIDLYFKKWNKIGMSSDFDIEKAKKVYKWLYDFCEIGTTPEICVCDDIVILHKALKKAGIENSNFLAEDRLYSSGYSAFYDYLSNIVKTKIPGFKEYKRFIEHSGIFNVCTENIVFCSLPPTELHYDDNDNLHNIKSQAVKFKTGYGLYYIHGQEFTKNEFEKYIIKKPKGSDIFKIDNVDKRTVLIQHYGYDKLFKDLPNKKTIHKMTCNQAGTDKKINYELFSYDLSNNITMKVLKVEWYAFGKKRQSVIGVASDVMTCEEARAKSFQKLVEGYKPDIEV